MGNNYLCFEMGMRAALEEHGASFDFKQCAFRYEAVWADSKPHPTGIPFFIDGFLNGLDEGGLELLDTDYKQLAERAVVACATWLRMPLSITGEVDSWQSLVHQNGGYVQ